jgi:hypothetical protein
MKRSASSHLLPLAVCLWLLLFLPAAYTACYFLTGEFWKAPPGQPLARCYRYRWQATLFIPAAKVETLVRSRVVMLVWFDESEGMGGSL